MVVKGKIKKHLNKLEALEFAQQEEKHRIDEENATKLLSKLKDYMQKTYKV
tara:strand:+ start:1236 stop:1388 length:153 start_codon:yes stop_codon:yes gene_type:complete